MVRRREASEKRRMAVGLRQCIRPLVELFTPGHDGYPLAFVPINWTVSKNDLYRYQVSKAWERPIAIFIFRQQTWQEIISLNRDF